VISLKLTEVINGIIIKHACYYEQRVQQLATNLTNDMVGMNFKCVDHDDAIVSLLCAIINNRVRDGEYFRNLTQFNSCL
jgi:hypothetical protein